MSGLPCLSFSVCSGPPKQPAFRNLHATRHPEFEKFRKANVKLTPDCDLFTLGQYFREQLRSKSSWKLC